MLQVIHGLPVFDKANYLMLNKLLKIRKNIWIVILLNLLKI